MRRDQLAHILRAASTIADDPDILVVGSQSILGAYSEDELPEDAFMSVEADIAFLVDEGGRKADQVAVRPTKSTGRLANSPASMPCSTSTDRVSK